ncbi:MAG: formylglycine-generating enzyme family protein [Pirellulales bacterium]|nr:formylglycine-generating enzyme family protein [Pirellulales bacterium]
MRSISSQVVSAVGALGLLLSTEVGVWADGVGLQEHRPPAGPSVHTDQGYMVAYVEQIPGTEITFEMIPIPGGEFLLGSAEDEPERSADEGPQLRVCVQPFWIGKCEVRWAEYRSFMELYDAFKSLESLRSERAQAGKLLGKAGELQALRKFFEQESLQVDGVTCPTPLYDPDTTYMAGEEPEQPAVTMTQFAAKQYTKWLSGITGKQYRLPTEAEWEYAARAGATTAYSFGSVEALDEYAWHVGNSDDLTHAVGTKKANPWGLHDMHGNAAEWVLDEYREGHYASLQSGVEAAAAVAWPTHLYPRTIRGGSYFDEPAQCRSAARHKSEDPEWNLSDPNLPRSPWWFTEYESTGVGFRILRPLKPMDKQEQKKVWDADIEELRLDVVDRLEEGRGTQSASDIRLPAAIQEMEAAGLIE